MGFLHRGHPDRLAEAEMSAVQGVPGLSMQRELCRMAEAEVGAIRGIPSLSL